MVNPVLGADSTRSTSISRLPPCPLGHIPASRRLTTPHDAPRRPTTRIMMMHPHVPCGGLVAGPVGISAGVGGRQDPHLQHPLQEASSTPLPPPPPFPRMACGSGRGKSCLLPLNLHPQQNAGREEEKDSCPPPPRPMTADQGFPLSSSSAGDWCLLPPVLSWSSPPPLLARFRVRETREHRADPSQHSHTANNSQPRAETIPPPLSPLPSRPWRVDRGRKGPGPPRGQAKGGFFLD